jgi:hypothetical protein
MTPEVAAAIEEIRQAFTDSEVTVHEDDEGGAYVIIETVTLGAPYTQQDTWLGFRITFQHPYADVYPHFVRGDLVRLDKMPLGEAMAGATFQGRAAVQISRRSNQRNAALDTPALKASRILHWLKARP